SSIIPPVRIGGLSPSCHHAYVGNVANAHAFVALTAARDQSVRDRMGAGVYFIVDQGPSNVFDLLAPVITKMGFQVPTLRLPDTLAYTIGSITDVVFSFVKPLVPKSARPKFTYSAVDMILTPRSINGEKLRRDTGWKPRYSEEEAAERTAEWFGRNTAFWNS
ncbi:hypothetical protein HDU93_003662, partial [Gonapodya sp. JEL0774]